MSEVEITTNNIKAVIEASDEAIERALIAVGRIAEEYAAHACPVQTGLLKNSITSAVGGKGTSISSYKADKPASKNKETASGSYSGIAPAEPMPYVIVGTNVKYAQSVELGSSKNHNPKPFIGPAIENHLKEYEGIIRSELEKG